jgi:heme iron utilization protein
MNDSEATKETIESLLKFQKLAVLSTHDTEQPYASLVAFAAGRDLKDLLFATARNTRKYLNMRTTPKVAMLIDSRSNRDSDFLEAVAVTAVGEAEEVADKEKEAWLEIYLTKHGHLEEFVRSPTCALVRVRVKSYYLVSRFQEVSEFRVET